MKIRTSLILALLCLVGLASTSVANASPRPRESDSQIRHIVENRAAVDGWIFVGAVDLNWGNGVVVAHVSRVKLYARNTPAQSCTWTAIFSPGKSVVPQQFECRNGTTFPVSAPPRTLFISQCDNAKAGFSVFIQRWVNGKTYEVTGPSSSQCSRDRDGKYRGVYKTDITVRGGAKDSFKARCEATVVARSTRLFDWSIEHGACFRI